MIHQRSKPIIQSARHVGQARASFTGYGTAAGDELMLENVPGLGEKRGNPVGNFDWLGKKCGFGQFSRKNVDKLENFPSWKSILWRKNMWIWTIFWRKYGGFTDTRNLPMKEETTKVVGYQGYYVMGILRCLRFPGVMWGDVLFLWYPVQHPKQLGKPPKKAHEIKLRLN